MKALIFSDSHGRCNCARQAWQMHAADTDAVFFLGDGLADWSFLPPTLPFYAVRGNNDFFHTEPWERTVTFDGMRIFLCHGHTFYVKSTLAHLIRHAVEIKADAALYGHTHRHETHYLNEEETAAKPLHLFGCGSIGLPFDGKCAYGILETYRSQILLTHATVGKHLW